MKDFFKPELRNRIDLVCKFKKLDTLAIKKIVVKFLEQVRSSLGAHNVRFDASEAVIEHLAEVGYDSKMGARPLNRKIDELIRVPLSKKILFERLSNVHINIDLQDSKVVFVSANAVANIPEPGIDTDGFITINS
jgi:ATP-dependent Clp protease ATP-binding subunit ClpA